MSRFEVVHHYFPSVLTAVECEPLPELARPIRDFVRNAAERLGACPDTAETARLLTSEVYANAVLHSGTSALLRIEVLVDHDCKRFIVSIEDHGTPTMSLTTVDPCSEAESGRGLVLVRLLAADCGAVPNSRGGKRVWFSLPLTPSL